MDNNSMDPQSTLIVVITLLTTINFPAMAEIRCYCNLPACVTTGYMCKSNQSTCFSEMSIHANDPLHSRHGCIEFLQRPKEDVCLGFNNNAKLSVAKIPLLLCCQEDMCNYARSLDLKIQINAKANETFYGNDDKLDVNNQPGDAIYQQDLWFSAAVIAVPIAGCVILVILVLLAIRMLKKDSKRQRQLITFRQQRHLKAQMLLDDHLNTDKKDYEQQFLPTNEDKNEANARLNHKQNNLYNKNVNLVLSTEPIHIL
uniref:BMP and activin membrane-bound inhibitor homolog n=1 Tax=Strigamia maritima TaxID=126957 RepID=T1IKU3_STRMM